MFRVGDLVINGLNQKAIVIGISADRRILHLMTKDITRLDVFAKNWKSTGKNFTDITEILNELRGLNDTTNCITVN